ncbi:hypothetical protein ABG768_005256, partial [Culter alburnus]
ARLGRLRCSAPGKHQAAKVPWQGPGMGPQEQKSLFVLTLPAETRPASSPPRSDRVCSVLLCLKHNTATR